jgi:hypothetical protein
MAGKGVVRWRRRERGSYIAEVGGLRVTIVNMKGDGPNPPRWQGPVPAWQVRLGGHGEYDVGMRVAHTAWTLGEAKAWAAENLPPR